MTTEDFSFPTENFPSGTIDSPPLWRSSSAASTAGSPQEASTSKKEEILCIEVGTKLADLNQRRSLSCIGRGRKRDDNDQEEKMDMLWEDFNEELWRSRSSKEDSDHQMVELGCVQALKLSKQRNNNKPSVVMVLKLLKKIFLLQNNSPTNHHNHHHHHHNHHHHHHHRSKIKTSRPW